MSQPIPAISRRVFHFLNEMPFVISFRLHVPYDENSKKFEDNCPIIQKFGLKLRHEARMDIFMAGGICIYEETDRFLTSCREVEGGGGGGGKRMTM